MTTVEDAPTGAPVTAEPEADERLRRRRWLVWPVLGAVLIAAGAGAWLGASNGSTEAAPPAPGPVATAVVERGTISATESWDGTLEYGTPYTVTSSAEGTVTRLAAQDETVHRGSELYRLNEQPVTLLVGVVPMYRDLRPGDSGVDVRQLEANLAELGFEGFAADDKYTQETGEAVREWQKDIGAAETGSVSRADVVFLPEGRRVDGLHVAVGASVTPGTPILAITGKDQIVTVDVDVDDRDLFDAGAVVTVVLRGGDEVPATVGTTAVVEVPPDSGGGLEDGTTGIASMVRVEITLDERVSVDLIGASIDVVVAIEERNEVLLVPVNALLALAEGGYGLEVVNDDSTTSIVAVDTGLFGEGKVQVAGNGIDEGTVVGVAGR